MAHAGGGAIAAAGGVAGGIGLLSWAGSVVLGAIRISLAVLGPIVVSIAVVEVVDTADGLDG